MKKKFLIIGVVGILLIGATIWATQLFNDRSIEKDEDNNQDVVLDNNYSEPVIDNNDEANYDGKVTMYIFHGKTCPTCIRTLEFLRGIIDDYDYLDIELFEVWNSEGNQKLVSEVEQALDMSIDYIPFIFIGADYHTYGFDEDKLISEIEKAHENKNYRDIIKPILDKTEIEYDQEKLEATD